MVWLTLNLNLKILHWEDWELFTILIKRRKINKGGLNFLTLTSSTVEIPNKEEEIKSAFKQTKTYRWHSF